MELNTSAAVAKRDYFKWMGNGRQLTIILNSISLIFIIGMLALPLPKQLAEFYIPLRIYLTLASAMFIFGLISIVKYHSMGIHIYFVFYTVLALISTSVSLYTISLVVPKIGQVCQELVDNCVSKGEYFAIGFNGLQILLFIVGWVFLLRFILVFRKQLRIWKECYKDEDGDACFYQWFDSSLKKTIDMEQ